VVRYARPPEIFTPVCRLKKRIPTNDVELGILIDHDSLMVEPIKLFSGLNQSPATF
jgi:hypothetical protein